MAIEFAHRTQCIVHGVDSSRLAVARARAPARARGLSDRVVFQTQQCSSPVPEPSTSKQILSSFEKNIVRDGVNP